MVIFKKPVYAILFIFFILLISGNAYSQVTIKAFTDTTDYLIGDHIHYTLEAEYDKNVTIFTPDIKSNFSNVDILSEEPAKTELRDTRVVTTYKFVFSRFDSSDVLIPPVPFKYGINIDTAGRVPFLIEEDTTLSTAYSNEVNFTVHSVKVQVGEDIKDIKAPITISPDWKIIALWIIGSLLAAALLIYFYLKYRKKKAVIPVRKKIIIIPPHIKALEDLKQLEKEQLWQRGEIKHYHSRVTEIIRNYFEERFKLPALELSTTEIIYHLKKQPGAEGITGVTEAFLNNADLVKFAKYIPLNSINEEMMKQAVDIVHNTASKEEIREEEIV